MQWHLGAPLLVMWLNPRGRSQSSQKRLKNCLSFKQLSRNSLLLPSFGRILVISYKLHLLTKRKNSARLCCRLNMDPCALTYNRAEDRVCLDEKALSLLPSFQSYLNAILSMEAWYVSKPEMTSPSPNLSSCFALVKTHRVRSDAGHLQILPPRMCPARYHPHTHDQQNLIEWKQHLPSCHFERNLFFTSLPSYWVCGFSHLFRGCSGGLWFLCATVCVESWAPSVCMRPFVTSSSILWGHG